MIRTPSVVLVVIAFLGGLTFDPDTASAWARWRNNELGAGCNDCHGHWFDAPYITPKGGTWPATLHGVHADFGHMATECNVCHRTDDAWNPFLNSSTGTSTAPAWGCGGCHGEDHGFAWPVSYGLTQHHISFAVGSNCDSCHHHQNLPTPLPESTMPVYYGLPDTNVTCPCNDDTDTSEDWNGDGEGLDNDGDGLYDAADPDCAASCGNDIKEGCEVCDGSDLDGNDCTTIGQGFGGGTLACLSDCTGWDTSVCESAGNCGNDVIDPGETCDPPSTCPASCPSQHSCNAGILTGTAGNCNAECIFNPILACLGGDGCCPAGCDLDNDSDCSNSSAFGSGCGCRMGAAGPATAVMLMLGALLLILLALRRPKT